MMARFAHAYVRGRPLNLRVARLVRRAIYAKGPSRMDATAKDFASVLPLTMSMKDLCGREKYASLSHSDRYSIVCLQ